MTSSLQLDLAAGLDGAILFEAAIGSVDSWQADVMRTRRNSLLLTGRQVGKSTTSACRAVWTALYQPGSLTACFSPSLRQSGLLYDKIREVHQAVGSSVGIEAESAVRLKLKNGSRILSLPSSEATTRGYSLDLAILDEAARIPDELWAAVTPMLAVTNGQLLALTTAWARRGAFYEAWTGSGDWLRVKIPSRMCSRISEAFLESERASMDAWSFDREYECKWASTAETAFSEEQIAAAVDESIEHLTI